MIWRAAAAIELGVGAGNAGGRSRMAGDRRLGSLYSFTVASRPTAPPWADSLPQILAIVELDQGPRLSSELVGIHLDDIRIGMRLKPVFDWR